MDHSTGHYVLDKNGRTRLMFAMDSLRPRWRTISACFCASRAVTSPGQRTTEQGGSHEQELEKVRTGIALPDPRPREPVALAQGSWKPGAPIPQGANEVIGANVGGLRARVRRPGSGEQADGLFWKFDPAANQWTQLPSNPVPVHHGAAAATGHKFYVFGGFRAARHRQGRLVSGEQGLGVRHG